MTTIENVNPPYPYQPYTDSSHVKALDGWTRERDRQYYLENVHLTGFTEEEHYLERMELVKRSREDLDLLLATALTFVFRKNGAPPLSGPVPLPLAAKIDLLRIPINASDHPGVLEELTKVAWALGESDRLVRQHLQKPGSVWLYELCELTDLLSHAGMLLHTALNSELPGFLEHASTLLEGEIWCWDA